jgi:hypothetical protein
LPHRMREMAMRAIGIIILLPGVSNFLRLWKLKVRGRHGVARG